MSNLEINDNTPQTVRKIAAQLRRVGWAGFWLQLVLALGSTVIFIFAVLFASTGASNPGTGISLLFVVVGLLVLYVSTYWSFRYVLTSRQLKNPDLRPKRADTIKLVQLIGLSTRIEAANTAAFTVLRGRAMRF